MIRFDLANPDWNKKKHEILDYLHRVHTQNVGFMNNLRHDKEYSNSKLIHCEQFSIFVCSENKYVNIYNLQNVSKILILASAPVYTRAYPVDNKESTVFDSYVTARWQKKLDNAL
jgi:hypothetical protein